MCTIKRVGRWGDFSPSAFYLLNIINDQPLFLTKVFWKHRCLTAVLQYLKIPKCCSDFLHKNLELACARACWGKGSAADVQESSVQDIFFTPLCLLPTSPGKPIPACQLGQVSVVVSFSLPSFIPILPRPLVPPSAQRRCPGCALLGAPAPGCLPHPSHPSPPVDRELRVAR